MVDVAHTLPPQAEPLRKPYSHWQDVATGTASALIAEGLVVLHELPGQLGRGKCMCTYLDGAPIPKGSGNGKTASHTQPGYRQITRLGADRYRVVLGIDSAAAELRRKVHAEHESAGNANYLAALAAHDWRIRVGESRADLVARRAHLQLVARA